MCTCCLCPGLSRERLDRRNQSALNTGDDGEREGVRAWVVYLEAEN